MQRTDLMDTKPWAHREIIRRLREMTPSQRLQMVMEATETGMAMNRLAMNRLEERLRANEIDLQGR
ncbi:hypothetical protein BH11ARM1_BH11ARM1_06030 [soil metagenome]